MPVASVWVVCGFLLRPRPLALLAMRRLSMTTALRLHHHLRATAVLSSGVHVFLRILSKAWCLSTTHMALSPTPISNSRRLSHKTTLPSTTLTFVNALSPVDQTTPPQWRGSTKAPPPPPPLQLICSASKLCISGSIDTTANPFTSQASSTQWPMTHLVCSTCPTPPFSPISILCIHRRTLGV